MTRPSPPPEPPLREPERLRHALAEDVRTVLATVPRDASPGRAQRALFDAGVLAPLPTVTAWLDAVRASDITHHDERNEHA